jgi:hypothetical protein
MLYEDYSPYTYDVPRPLRDVCNIGWLNSDDYPHGRCSPEVLRRLAKLILREQVNVLRCTSPCSICGRDGITVNFEGLRLFLGAGELWIPSVDHKVTYASPDLIWHYVHDHEYRPPVQFIDAVMQFDLESLWKGEVLRNDMLRETYQDPHLG